VKTAEGNAEQRRAGALRGIAERVEDPHWRAVLARDPGADGRFVYAVRSTGIYCRPSCPSRRPRRENVTFHATPVDAERAGFRPCKRCRPDAAASAGSRSAMVARLCRMIETAERAPALAELAAHAGLSRFHVQRVFKAETGLSPRSYAAAQRARRMREALAGGATVTRALYDAGYGASARFYAEADAVLGMAPSAYRAGGTNMEIRYASGQCSLGWVLVAQSARGVCAILLGDDPVALGRELAQRFRNASLVEGGAAFAELVERVLAFVDAPRLGLELPLDVQGTAFQQRVWQALRAIPAGETLSYAELARRIGAPRAVRAVAAACAANTIAVAVPCHRAVRSDGALAGYRWGVERKRALLERERERGD